MHSFTKSVPALPLITVIVAVYNNVRTLQQCIDSVVLQSYPNKELIIIDGGSTDGSAEILPENQANISYWISESDRGVYDAWNKGLAQAKGEWICFLGADDYFWGTRVLECTAAELTKLPMGIRVAYGQIMVVGDDGECLYLIGEPWTKAKDRFMQVMSIPHPGMMHRRDLFEQIGNFDDTFRIAGDYELLLRELKTGDAYFLSDIVLVGMRRGGISSDPANAWLGVRELRLAQRKNNLGLPGGIWLLAAIKSYLRLLLWRVFGKQLATRVLDLSRYIKGLPALWMRRQ